MAVDLHELLAPAHTALLTMELQRGTVGDLPALPALAGEAAALGVVPNAARLASAARAHGVRVVHCTAEFRADRAGSSFNAPLLAALRRDPGHMTAGSPAAELVPELGPRPDDIVSSRVHGISPFTGTSLDQTLRNLGVRTVLAVGVSVNLGIVGLCIEAVNLGYRVALVTDAVAGVPREYADAVVANTLALLATRVTVDDVLAAWDTGAPARA